MSALSSRLSHQCALASRCVLADIADSSTQTITLVESNNLVDKTVIDEALRLCSRLGAPFL